MERRNFGALIEALTIFVCGNEYRMRSITGVLRLEDLREPEISYSTKATNGKGNIDTNPSSPAS